MLNHAQCASMIVELVMMSDDVVILDQSIQLGIHLLENGNSAVQESFYEKLCQSQSSKFFEILSRYMQQAEMCEGNEDELMDEDAVFLQKCMWRILRFLQLLCENHNRKLQNLLRVQRHKNKAHCNLVRQTLHYVDVFGLAMYVNAANVHNIIQALRALTEFCTCASRPWPRPVDPAPFDHPP